MNGYYGGVFCKVYTRGLRGVAGTFIRDRAVECVEDRSGGQI
jgi:hypothetical protein